MTKTYANWKKSKSTARFNKRRETRLRAHTPSDLYETRYLAKDILAGQNKSIGTSRNNPKSMFSFANINRKNAYTNNSRIPTKSSLSKKSRNRDSSIGSSDLITTLSKSNAELKGIKNDKTK